MLQNWAATIRFPNQQYGDTIVSAWGRTAKEAYRDALRYARSRCWNCRGRVIALSRVIPKLFVPA